MFLKKYWIYFALAGVCLFIIFGLEALIRNSVRKGPDFSELRLKITHRILDSCASGLEKYKKINGRYPQSSDKYFFNSIKYYVLIDDAYIYSDSLTRMQRNSIGQVVKENELLFINILYLGIGSKEQYINYKSISLNTYILYSVGENCADDNGNGDDIVYGKHNE